MRKQEQGNPAVGTRLVLAVTAAIVDDGVVTATGDVWTEIAASASGRTDAVQIVVVTPNGASRLIHQGKWGGCSTCHVDSSDYTNFSCFACHPHFQDRMDDQHSGMSGYAYDSDRCYACHPAGEAD